MLLGGLLSLTLMSSAQVCNICDSTLSINNGLIACYPFDNHTNDASENGHHGTPTNISYGTDRFGNPLKCASLNGTSSEITVSQAGFRNDNYTYSAWINIASYPSSVSYTILSIGSNTADQFLKLTNNGVVTGLGYTSYSSNGATTDHFEVGTLPTLNTWHHIVLTRTTSSLKFYVNGVLLNTLSVTTPAAAYGTGGQFMIGSRSGSYPHVQFFKGLMDDVRIYNRALTNSEINTLYTIPNNPFTVNAGSDKTIYRGDSTQLSVNTVNSASYLWVPSTGLSNDTIANPIANPLVTTQYTIKVSNEICSMVDTIIVHVDSISTGLSSAPMMGTIKVFPNPAHDFVLIENDVTLSGYSLQIVNTLGQLVYTHPMNQQALSVSTAKLGGPGTYFIQILNTNAQVVEVRKLIIR